MKQSKLLSLVFWPVVIVAPFLATFIAAAQFPLGIEAPLHWDFSGRVDRWGSPWTMLPVSLIMSVANVLMCVMYCYGDRVQVRELLVLGERSAWPSVAIPRLGRVPT